MAYCYVLGSVGVAAGADAGAHREEHEVPHPAAQPVGPLAQCGEVDVVLEADHGAQLRADRLDQPLAPPAGQFGAWASRPRSGSSTPGWPTVAWVTWRHQSGLTGNLVGDMPDLLDQRGRAPRGGRLVAAGDQLARDVGHGRTHVPAADIDPDHPAGLRVETVEHRARPAAPCAANLLDQARRHQPVQGQRHGRLGKAALARDLATGRHPGRAHQLEDGPFIDRP